MIAVTRIPTVRCTLIDRWPPVFLAPVLSMGFPDSATFSTSTSRAARQPGRKGDRNPNRGVSALRRTGLRNRVEMSRYPLPKPVLDPEKRSKVAVDEKHGLWGFFRDKKALNTPEETVLFGRPWVVEELRHKSWEDLHLLWWACCKELNILETQKYERTRLKAGYGEAEILDRVRAVSSGRRSPVILTTASTESHPQVRSTQKAIKHALTERYYAFEEARRVAVNDPEVNLDAEPGTQAYTPIYSDEADMEEEYPVTAAAG
ncbi:MAG: hypothetical protein Q9220_004852 [cf. Caloplaca sp. 1 TL-2023]